MLDAAVVTVIVASSLPSSESENPAGSPVAAPIEAVPVKTVTDQRQAFIGMTTLLEADSTWIV